jgi:hypothetical protein
LSQQESDRLIRLYNFLLTLIELSQPGSPKEKNISFIERQWGLSDPNQGPWDLARDRFVEKVIRAVEQSGKPTSSPPTLSLSDLVKILESIDKDRNKHHESSSGLKIRSTKPPSLLTRAEKLKALRLFSELSTTERETLRLSIHPSEALLQRLTEEALAPTRAFSREAINRLYHHFLDESSNFGNGTNRLNVLDEGSVTDIYEDSLHSELIRSEIGVVLKEAFGDTSSFSIDEYVEKVERELSRIRFQSGVQQVSNRASLEHTFPRGDYVTPSFVRRLARSVVENEILTAEFPVFIKYIEIEKVRPLPLSIYKKGVKDFGVLNSDFIEEGDLSISGLEQQYTYRVRVYFYIRLPEDIRAQRREENRTSENEERLEFFEEIIGVGSPMALVTAAINRVLLWDIPCLRDYFPIARQLYIADEIVGGSYNSPVWSHAVIQLCRQDKLEQAIAYNSDLEKDPVQGRQPKSYDDVEDFTEVAYGDFCGFDFIEVAAKSALNARLRAIKQTGIKSRRYIEQLCIRIDETQDLNKAKKYLNYYPFSFRAMKAYLDENLFENGRYRRRPSHFSEKTDDSDKRWSLIAYSAYLAISEALLVEGKYEAAKVYLESLKSHDRAGYFKNNLIKARYHILQAQYYYLSSQGRFQSIEKCLLELEEADRSLTRRVEMCQVIDELTQINAHPFFNLRGKIYLLCAWLCLGFSEHLNKHKENSNNNCRVYNIKIDSLNSESEISLAVLKHLEKAKVYMAQDGSANDYAYCSAIQAWIYFMTAHSYPDKKDDYRNYINWAKRLLEHSRICYFKAGRICYHQLKIHAGQSNDLKIGNLSVETLPFITEYQGQDSWNEEIKQKYEPRDFNSQYSVLALDISIFRHQERKIKEEPIYLFGPYAGIIIFAEGLILLQNLFDETIGDSGIDIKVLDRTSRYFITSWALSQDGGNVDSPEGKSTLRRSFSRKVSQSVDESFDRVFGDFDRSNAAIIQGLYPHRISYVVVISSIFMMICSVLSLFNTYVSSKKNSEELKSKLQDTEIFLSKFCNDLHEREAAERSETLSEMEQSCYNLHLEAHLLQVQEYFMSLYEKFESGKIKKRSKSRRAFYNKLIHHVFSIMCGKNQVDELIENFL